VRIMFFDFSSTFNTIQPLLLRDMRVDSHLVRWIVGCVKDGWEGEYRSLVEDFVGWSNRLQLNTTKTKDMVVDFRRKKPKLQPVSIEGVDVEVVRTYKYLGLQLDDRLDWTAYIHSVHRKGQSRLYFLRRLGSFNPEKAGVLQHLQKTAADVLPVGGGQRPLLRCGLLGR